MSEIIFERVVEGYEKLDVIRQIYEEAFPENERGVSADELVHISTLSEYIGVIAAVEDDKIIGMLTLLAKPEYCYLMYLAVNNELRGKGLGSRIMTALINYYSDRPIVFSIETPVEGGPGYEQRIRRQAFYERLGCIKSNILLKYGEDSYTYYSTRACDNIKELIVDYMYSSNEERGKCGQSANTSGSGNLIECLVEV